MATTQHVRRVGVVFHFHYPRPSGSPAHGVVVVVPTITPHPRATTIITPLPSPLACNAHDDDDDEVTLPSPAPNDEDDTSSSLLSPPTRFRHRLKELDDEALLVQSTGWIGTNELLRSGAPRARWYHFGNSNWWVTRRSLSPECIIAPFTGDNLLSSSPSLHPAMLFLPWALPPPSCSLSLPQVHRQSDSPPLTFSPIQPPLIPTSPCSTTGMAHSPENTFATETPAATGRDTTSSSDLPPWAITVIWASNFLSQKLSHQTFSASSCQQQMVAPTRLDSTILKSQFLFIKSLIAAILPPNSPPRPSGSPAHDDVHVASSLSPIRPPGACLHPRTAMT
ncbi:hypothetical protein EV363DRAFT_1539712 [Boletus edulis]|nr:hypothetical protein EV363DRAFT_1539712 [Boletus edulis]